VKHRINHTRAGGEVDMVARLLLTLGVLSMTGCLFTVDSDRQEGVSPWSEGQVARIERGSTSADWVLSSFGDPERITRYEDGSEVWRYSKSSKVETEVGLFLLFHVDVEKEYQEQLFIEIRDARVKDYWMQSNS